MSVHPEKSPADWSKYETNETSPGIYILTEEQSTEFMAEIAAGTCPRCGDGLINRSMCNRCDMLIAWHPPLVPR